MSEKYTDVVWQETPCPLCRQHEGQLLLEVKTPEETQPYRLIRCDGCGVGYLNPRPTPETIGVYYPPEYLNYQPRAERPAKGRWKRRLEQVVLASYFDYPSKPLRWHDHALATAVRRWFGPRSDTLSAVPFVGQGRLLDYGCGTGAFAHRMRERGWNVVAMDFNHDLVKQVHARYGLDVVAGTLPHADVPDESFDVVTMGSVLEHVHEPHDLVSAIHRVLRPGGVLAISVPNLDSWQYRYFGRDWWSLELPRHLLHFTPATLRRLVEDHGFEVRDLQLPGRTGWMRRSINRARDSGRRQFLLSCAQLPLVPSLLTHYTVQTQQADCIQIMAFKPQRSQRAA